MGYSHIRTMTKRTDESDSPVLAQVTKSNLLLTEDDLNFVLEILVAVEAKKVRAAAVSSL
ncbi:hypothetical protein ACFL1X_14770 [Candidatus Hydrogenedentota bacterium]